MDEDASDSITVAQFIEAKGWASVGMLRGVSVLILSANLRLRLLLGRLPNGYACVA